MKIGPNLMQPLLRNPNPKIYFGHIIYNDDLYILGSCITISSFSLMNNLTIAE